MRLIGYIKPYNPTTFSIPVYGEPNSCYYHELDSDFNIKRFVSASIRLDDLQLIEVSREFQIGDVGAVAFIKHDLSAIYGPLNEVHKEISQTVKTYGSRYESISDELQIALRQLSLEKMSSSKEASTDNIFVTLISEVLKKRESTFEVVALKGFTNAVVRTVAQRFQIVGNALPIDDNGKIILENIDSSFLDLLASLKSVTKSDPGILLFESLLFLSKEINIDQLKKRVLIIENNFFNEYLNQSNQNNVDLEKTIESAKEVADDNLFSKFYSNSIEKDGAIYVEFIDGIAEDFTSVEKVFLLDEDNFEELKSLPNLEDASGYVLLQPFNKAFEELKLSLTQSRAIDDLKFVVDKTSISQKAAQVEISRFLSFLSQAQIKCEIYELDQRLSITFRPVLVELLKEHWHSNEFRPLKIYKDPDVSRETIDISQGAIVENVIHQFEEGEKGRPVRDILLTAPTGAGKSLLFQMPAFYLAANYNAVTIVISPLIALMKDQVHALRTERQYNAVAYLNSELSLIERGDIIQRVYQGDVSIIYMSPELLLSYDLSMFIGERKLGLLVIDEAHLVTTWGRDFRVDYWYLGNYIRKIRKYFSYKFPVLAVTATAVYNGPNDMAFETLDSLSLENPIMYIGRARRDEIKFKLTQTQIGTAHEKAKVALTARRIEELIETGEKIIVYCPWTSQLPAIRDALASKYKTLTGLYFSGLDKDIKNETYQDFKTNKLRAVISTKAFGMGVDIDDITVVYHHAPSGHLADYVQEIGRLARKPTVGGVAMMDFNTKDLKFSKILYGLSSIKQYQVQLVLEKISKIYDIKRKRNLLVSVADFEYIFNYENVDIEQKVKSSLLLIEKDLLTKYRYNVLLARPKSLFTTVFIRLREQDQNSFLKKYGRFCRYIPNARMEIKSMYVYTVELDKLWEEHYSDISFPLMKKQYFDKLLFEKENFDVTPQLRLIIHLNKAYSQTFDLLTKIFEQVEASLASFGGGFFKKQDFFKHLEGIMSDKLKAKRISDLILSIYSSPLNGIGPRPYQFVEPECFIQQKRTDGDYVYRVISRSYPKVKSSLRARFERMFLKAQESNSHTFFLPLDDKKNTGMIKMAYVIEAFDLGSYEISGGEKPSIFVRLNDPFKLRKLKQGGYTNNILAGIDKRQKTSVQIMDNFFAREMNNEDRWDFIEAYFLGQGMDDLPGNKIDDSENLND